MEHASRTTGAERGPRQTHQVIQGTPLDVYDTGKSLKVQAERPHLVSLGSGRLSVAITLLPLLEGRTTLGSEEADIPLQGAGVAPQHCYIQHQAGCLTLYPCGNQCSVDGLAVTRPTRLTQGCMLCFGQSAFFRFNHPEEALRMKSMNASRSHQTGEHLITLIYPPGYLISTFLHIAYILLNKINPQVILFKNVMLMLPHWLYKTGRLGNKPFSSDSMSLKHKRFLPLCLVIFLPC
uniref:FHA domain-containing protein n=1 Tax=Gadus morhua TaxID=8049 RepID=A0A8C5B0R6_GADMO